MTTSGGCGGCGGGGGGCGGCGGGGGGGCGGCPRKRGCCSAPIALLAFNRTKITELVSEVVSATKEKEKKADIVVVSDPEKGLVMQSAGTSKVAVAEALEFERAIDPIVGWSYESAKKSPAVGLVPAMAVAVVDIAVVEAAISASRPPNNVFFGLIRGGGGGRGCCGGGAEGDDAMFTLKAVPHGRLTDEEYSRAREPTEWPPQAGKGAVTVGGFAVDSVSFACEQIRGAEWLFTGKEPKVGQQIYLHVVLGEAAPAPPSSSSPAAWTRMVGKVTWVGAVPAEGAAVDPVIGESFFKTCECGRPHPRAELLRELGTLHGQRIRGTFYVVPEQVGQAPASMAGQWEVTLVADDTKQALWQIEGQLVPVPRESWIPWIPRS